MPQLFLGVLTGGGDLFSRLVDGVQYNAVIKVSLCWMAEKWRRRLFLWKWLFCMVLDWQWTQAIWIKMFDGVIYALKNPIIWLDEFGDVAEIKYSWQVR